MAFDTLRDAMSAVLADMPQELDEPADPLGYGVDAWCQFDVDEVWSNVDPNSPEGISNSIIRMLITGRGTLREAQHRGVDLRLMWHAKITALSCAEMSARVKAEVLLNDRVQSADVTIEQLTMRDLFLRIRFTPKNSSETFELVFRLSQGKAELL